MNGFVGRDGELSKLEYVLEEAALGTGRLVLVSGQPGIGKSRLAQELGRRAETRGFGVVWGRSWEAEGTPAYWPWTEALEALHASPIYRDVVAQARAESPSLAAVVGQETGTSEGRSEPSKAAFQLGVAMVRLLASASAVAPLVLVLDDLHVADTASLELLAFVARRLTGTRVLCVGTTRDAPSIGSRETLERLSSLGPDATQLALSGLTREAVLAWVAQDAPALVAQGERVFEGSAGSPLFVRELLSAWQSGTPGTALPLGIRGAIRAHLQRVNGETRRVLDVASVLGREVSIDVLRALAPGADLVARLEEASAASILINAAEGRVRFAHALVRDELYAELHADERARLHRVAARRLAPELDQAESAAHHALLGADAASAASAMETALAGMAAASAKLAFSQAAALGVRAQATLGTWLGPQQESRLMTALGEAQIHAGAREQGQRTCVLAAERAEGDGALLARAALAYAIQQRFGRQPEAVVLLRKARAALGERGDRSLRALVLARLATAMVPPLPEETEEPLALAREALRLARELGEEDTRLLVFTMLGTVFPEEFSVAERFSLNAEAIALAEKLGQVASVSLLFGWQIACWLELARLDGARQELEFAEKRFALMPPHFRWRGAMLRALLAGLEGRFDEADELGRAVLRAGGEGAMFASIQQMVLPYLRGDADSFHEVDAEVSRIHAVIPGSKAFMTIADALCGRVDNVRRALEAAREQDLSGIPGVEQLGWPVVRCGLSELAPFYYELAVARARSPLSFGPGAMSTFGPRELLAGRLAHLAARPELAKAHLGRALAFCTQLGSQPLLAQTELALAEVLASLGDGAAQGHAAAAHAIAAPLAMRSVTVRAAELAGTRVASAPPAETAALPVLTMTRRGELWVLSAGAREIVLKDARGLAYLEVLVAAPHREVHVLELLGTGDAGDAGPVLDEKAKAAYRARADDLRDQLEEAMRFGDGHRAERLREELELLGDELARAVGLGGRDKRAASMAERARINVQRRLRDVIRWASEASPYLGRHLELSVKTGVFCRYAPTWPSERP